MRKIIAVCESGGGLAVPLNARFLIKSARKILYYEWTFSHVLVNYEANAGANHRVNELLSGNNGILVRMDAAQSAANPQSMTYITIWGDFNPDELEITTEGLDASLPVYPGRLEIRNENFVLITDNGLPWHDGTYPPDAKNRAGLAGLHSAPAVIKPELETALMGDETDKERVQE